MLVSHISSMYTNVPVIYIQQRTVYLKEKSSTAAAARAALSNFSSYEDSMRTRNAKCWAENLEKS